MLVLKCILDKDNEFEEIRVVHCVKKSELEKPLSLILPIEQHISEMLLRARLITMFSCILRVKSAGQVIV